MSAADFEPAKARCSLLARHGGSDFVAYGSRDYVAGATLGHAIGESIRTQQDFNDCMSAGGWRIADGQNSAAQSAAGAQLRAISEQRAACVAEIRNKPDYIPLLAHLRDIHTGNYSMAQLTDERVPTPAESKLLTTYVDEISPCGTKAIEAASRVVPAIGPILMEARSSSEATEILLIERKVSWGEAAQRTKQLADDTNTKLRQVHL